MSQAILFLGDGMADEPLAELGGQTPLEAASTPNMDAIARAGASGDFLTLPGDVPTSSDVANISVLGYDPVADYTGRGPLEALGAGIEIGPHDIAWRCNLVTVADGILLDYSAGHLETSDARTLIEALQEQFGNAELTFHAGVSYRHILMLHGDQFTDKVHYSKPDASQDRAVEDILLEPAAGDAKSQRTAALLNDLARRSHDFLNAQPANRDRPAPANMIWPWSPGRLPQLLPFSQKYGIASGAVISAVDVIFGLGAAVGLDLIRVPGATGFVDTNYEGKADAAVDALADHDFVYLHVEAADECGHTGDIDLKRQAIEDFDRRVVGRVRQRLEGQEVSYAVLPDHPVPVKKRVHTRVPVPVAVCGPHIQPDDCQTYGETVAPTGGLGHMQGDQLMRLLLHC